MNITEHFEDKIILSQIFAQAINKNPNKEIPDGWLPILYGDTLRQFLMAKAFSRRID